MRIIPLAEVLKMEPGETVASVRATVKAIFDRNTGTNSHGDWSLQNVILIDSNGTEIKAKIDGREVIPSAWKNKSIVISCHSGDKGLTGIKAKDEEYRGKVSRILSVTPSATMELAESAPAEPPDESETDQPATKSKPAAAATKPPVDKPATAKPASAPANGDQNVKISLNRMANLYIHCLIAGDYVRRSWEEREKRSMTPEQIQACVSSLFIQTTRSGLDIQVHTGPFED